MDVHEILACELVGVMFFLIICYGVALIISAVGNVRNDRKETELLKEIFARDEACIREALERTEKDHD